MIEIGSSQWRSLVERALKAHTSAGWVIGDILVKAIPVGSEVTERLCSFSDETGIPLKTLSEYRDTALAYPVETRTENSFTAHARLRFCEDRAELLKVPMTSREANRIYAELNKNDVNPTTLRNVLERHIVTKGRSRGRTGLFRKVEIGLSAEQFEWLKAVTETRHISESGYMRDLIDEDMKRSIRRRVVE